MSVVDAIFFGTVAVGLALGIVRGFLTQITGLIGLLGGAYLAWRYGGLVRQKAVDPYLTTDYNAEIAFCGVLVVSLLLTALVSWVVRKIFERLEVSAYDRLMGGVFGALKAALICAGIMLGMVALANDGGEIERAIGSSRSGPLLWQGMEQAAGLLPPEVRGDVRAFLKTNSLPRSSDDEEPQQQELRIRGGDRR
jgi:membrane protein required for colicin V production